MVKRKYVRKKTKVLGITAIVGDTQAFLERNEKPLCARCSNRKKMTRAVVLTQLGMIEDITTVVFQCPQCLEFTAYTYSIELEISNDQTSA